MSKARYANGMVYKMVSDVDDLFYIGSTCVKLTLRKCRHKSTAKVKPDRQVYAHFNTIGWENVKIIMIEKVPCNDKYELEQRERHHIELLKPTLNMVISDSGTICDHGKKRIKCNECRTGSECNPKIECKPKIHNRFDCPCGSSVTFINKIQHYKTKKHISYMEANPQIDE
jgi:hypothetical protein